MVLRRFVVGICDRHIPKCAKCQNISQRMIYIHTFLQPVVHCSSGNIIGRAILLLFCNRSYLTQVMLTEKKQTVFDRAVMNVMNYFVYDLGNRLVTEKVAVLCFVLESLPIVSN